MLHDRLISRSKQNCESLTYLASQCDERLLRTEKVSVTASDVRNIGKKSISSKKAAKIFRNAENFIDIEECTKTLSLLNTLMLRYLRKIQCICGNLLANMSNDLLYILCCDLNFFPRVNI